MYEKVCNTLIFLSIVGIGFIGCSIPVLAEPMEEEQVVLRGMKAPALPTVEAPDPSLAFEIKANREKALSVFESFEVITEYIDHIEPEAEIPPKLTYVGNFYLTMYAATVEQCGNTLGITASGKKVTEDPSCHTVAVDPKVIPLGTYLKIDLPGYEDVIFQATDTGGDIKNYWIDIYTDSEPLSKSFNPCYADVYIVEFQE